jgi:hypothetical protein
LLNQANSAEIAFIGTDGGNDDFQVSLDLIESKWNSDKTALQFPVPTSAWFKNAKDELTVEFFVVVADGANTSKLPIEGAPGCLASSIGLPLGKSLQETKDLITSPFGENGHKGVDFGVPDGTPVFSVADGTVFANDYQLDDKVTNPRTGKKGMGWGNYIVVKHKDGSYTLFAHLESKPPLKIGNPVGKGEQIGMSGHTGGVTGAHLHLEYIPNSKVYDKSNPLKKGNSGRIDPMPCMDSRNSSVYVYDSGNIKDDAFAIALDNRNIGETAAGGGGDFGVNNLLSGSHKLTILCTIAPDNIGTYTINLGDGITFTGGGTSYTGVLPEGSSEDLTIDVPGTLSGRPADHIRIVKQNG